VKFLKHILLFCCCLLVLPFLSVTNANAAGYDGPCCCNDGTYFSSVSSPSACTSDCASHGGRQWFDQIISCTPAPPPPPPPPPPVGCPIDQCGASANSACDSTGGDIYNPGCGAPIAGITCGSNSRLRILTGHCISGTRNAYWCQVDATCSTPINGTCGTANGGRFYTPPTTGLCDLGDGVATPAPSGTGPHPHSWTWTCGGSGGGSASPPCTATQMYDGVCGSSHYQFLTSEPTTNLCAPGFPASPVAGTGPWNWSCEGLNTGLTTNCTSRIAVNGSCGTADGVTRSTAPSANLCGAGTPSSVTGTGPWNWTCDGTGVGTRSASCSAPLPPPPPSFGGACPS
jgi:hypothetical protein